MTPRDRILEAAMSVFRRHGFRRSSIEAAAEAAGLTRQALYHHFKSREALFRAVIERLHDGVLERGAAAAIHAARDGDALADVVVAVVIARLKGLIASFDGSPHVEELYSEHMIQARDLAVLYAERYEAQLAEVIARTSRREKLALVSKMTPAKLAHYAELAVKGVKSAYPAMSPTDAFLRDVEAMLRTLIAGAVAQPTKLKPKATAGPVRRKQGDRK
jgi:TetR/AcrR family acrAB operon transcriptional repressor